MKRNPTMSVVLVTPHRYETLRKVMRRLRAQTIAAQLEVVIVAPSLMRLAFDESERSGFLRVQVVESGESTSLGVAKAAGVRAAAAPVVAFAEDHCYPEPDWAAQLLAAHAGPWAAVAPAIGNANPEEAVSWANLLIAYGHWLAPAVTREIHDVPAHNSSYKRDVLLGYGPELDTMLGREGSLHADLRAQGHKLYITGAARAYHLNPTRAPDWWILRFNAGRLYAATRAAGEGWSQARRMIYAGGAPLVPLMRLPQLLGQLRQAGLSALLPRIFPALLLGLLIHSAGELAGYIVGEGGTREYLANFEYDRIRQLARADRIRHLEVV
ncbi:MAG: glycosyltransferase [Oscillochloris sp.]|nr:glycosyltransferase [Oscillochloris sp.]